MKSAINDEIKIYPYLISPWVRIQLYEKQNLCWNDGKFPQFPCGLLLKIIIIYTGSPRVLGQWFNRVEKNCVTNE